MGSKQDAYPSISSGAQFFPEAGGDGNLKRLALTLSRAGTEPTLKV